MGIDKAAQRVVRRILSLAWIVWLPAAWVWSKSLPPRTPELPDTALNSVMGWATAFLWGCMLGMALVDLFSSDDA